MPFLLSKDNLDFLSAYTKAQKVELTSTMFTPFTSKDFSSEREINKRIRTGLNCVFFHYNIDLLILASGMTAAACCALKGVVEELLEEPSDESFEYSKSLFNASWNTFTLIVLDVINMLTRLLATAITSLFSVAEVVVAKAITLGDAVVETVVSASSTFNNRFFSEPCIRGENEARSFNRSFS